MWDLANQSILDAKVLDHYRHLADSAQGHSLMRAQDTKALGSPCSNGH